MFKINYIYIYMHLFVESRLQVASRFGALSGQPLSALGVTGIDTESGPFLSLFWGPRAL